MANLNKPFIGQLNRVIEIFKCEKTINEIGEEKLNKSLITVVFAHLEEMGGTEEIQGNIRHLNNRKFTIRYNALIQEQGQTLVLKYRDIEHQITQVIEIGRKSHLQLICYSYA